MGIQTAEHAQLAQDLGTVLARLYGFLRRAILPKEMSLTQVLALSTLRDLGSQRVTDLAGIEGVRQPTCTGLVNTMEARGWVKRAIDEADRRAVLVELTAEGRAVLDGITAARADVLGHYLNYLSTDERGALRAALPGLTRLIEVGTAGEEAVDTSFGADRAVPGVVSST